jgi:hypothetical protein
MSKTVGIFLLATILLSVPCLAYALGVSPAEITTCVAPGSNSTVWYKISSSSSQTERLTISVVNLTWIYFVPAFEMTAGGTVQYPFTAAPTADMPPGRYATDIKICSAPIKTNTTMTVEACLQPKLYVDVDPACPSAIKPEFSFEQERIIIVSALLIAIAALVAIYLMRHKRKKR